MSDSIYVRLQEQLDQYSVGFPAVESGVERRMLKKLFTVKEAELFLALTMKPETPESIARRSGRNAKELHGDLERMFEKGLVFRISKDNETRFGALPFAPGILEQQSESMGVEFAELFESYFHEAFDKSLTRTSPVLIHRPVPVNRVVDVSYPMAVYDNSREIVRKQDLIAVAKCICRVQKGEIEMGCDKPLETCMMFGSQAQYYIDRGTGRSVTVEEALEILDRCEEAGLVTMPFNAQSPANICNCCPDCCVVLRALKKHPRPAVLVKPDFCAAVDKDVCEGCGTCTERCPMEAVTLEGEEVAGITADRCIGCGLCVGTCPAGALHLELRPANERLEPPITGLETFMEISRRRRHPPVPSEDPAADA